MANYGIKYILQWESENENQNIYKIEISQKDFTGQSVVKSLGSAPVLRQDAASSGICGTSLEMSIQADIDKELEGFFTTDNKNFKVVEYCNNAIIWQGFVLPELYSEPYIAAPYDVAITASDQLAVLKNIDYVPSGRKSFLHIIDGILKKTGLSLGYEIICSLKPSYMGDDESMLASVGIDDTAFTNLTCYDALAAVMLSLNATITQRKGRWLIMRANDITAKSVFYSSTLALESVSQNTAATIGKYGQANLYPIGSLTMSKDPAKSGFEIEYLPIMSPSMFLNAETTSAEHWTYDVAHVSPPMFTSAFDRDDEQAGIRTKINSFVLLPPSSIVDDSYPLSQTLSIGAVIDNFTLSVAYKAFKKVDVEKEGMLGMRIKMIGLDSSDNTNKTLYLSSEGWVSEVKEFTITGEAVMNAVAAKANKDNYDKITLKFGSLPLTGDLTIEFANKSYSPVSDHAVEMAVSNVFLAYEDIPGYSSGIKLVENASQKGEKVELAFSDHYGLTGEWGIVYSSLSLATNLYAGEWALRGVNSTFYKSILQDYANTYGLVRSRFSGLIAGASLLHNLYLDSHSNSILRVENYTINQLTEEMSCELIHIPGSSASISDFEITTTEGKEVIIGTATENAPSSDGALRAEIENIKKWFTLDEETDTLTTRYNLKSEKQVSGGIGEGGGEGDGGESAGINVAMTWEDAQANLSYALSAALGVDLKNTVAALKVKVGDTVYSNINGVITLPEFASGGGASSWDEITGKPSWIGSSKPSYSWSEINNKPSWIGSSKPSYSWSEINNKPTWIGSSKPSYSWSEINSKPSWIGSSKPSYSADEISGLGSASVGYATNAGNADTVDNYHASALAKQADMTAAKENIALLQGRMESAESGISSLQTAVSAIQQWFTLSNGTLRTTYNLSSTKQLSGGIS